MCEPRCREVEGDSSSPARGPWVSVSHWTVKVCQNVRTSFWIDRRLNHIWPIRGLGRVPGHQLCQAFHFSTCWCSFHVTLALWGWGPSKACSVGQHLMRILMIWLAHEALASTSRELPFKRLFNKSAGNKKNKSEVMLLKTRPSQH